MNEAENPPLRQERAPKLHHAVFISYSSHDERIAGAICAALEAEAIRCWIAPRDVQGGRPYSGQITQAIREARVLLLVLSQTSNRSKQVLREVERAAHCQNHLLTFRIEAVAPGDDLAYFLGADHWVDGFRPLPPSEHFSALIQHTRSLLQREAEESSRAVESDADTSESFAHFRVLRRPDGSLFRVGKGGMGVTYKAIDTVLNRPVALKVIAAELLRSPASRQRFLREARAAALIHHPHVATIFHFGEEADAYFYAMEFVDGEDLERYVAKHGPLPPATALQVVLQVAQALEAAQARRLIHRDIKPGNIMVVTNRTGKLDVKLIDFGLAKGTGTEALDSARITRTQDFVGSPAFASPEQCEMEKLDTRSDIYSLGVTLWYLLSGKRPFSGTVGQVLIAQVVKPPPFEELAQVPQPVIALLERMLRKRPDERFQTPQELQDGVEAAAAKLALAFGAEQLTPEVATAPLNEAGPAIEDQSEPVLLTTPAASLFDQYLAVEVGTLVASRYRLVAEEREGNGGRFFHARDERATAEEPSEVGLKQLHPGIAADPELLDLLDNEIEVIRRATHPHLVRYWRSERGISGPWLVREWVHGFLLYDLLRWSQSLRPVELLALLGPLASTLDFVSSQGLGLVDVSVRKILVACPKEIAPAKFSEFARGDVRDWNRCRLLLNPLSLAPLLFRSRNGWDRQTIVPGSRVLSMTQAQAGIRGSKAVRLYGRLVYELFSGRAPVRSADPQKYTPLPDLDQAGNETLRRACVGTDPDYRDCETFWTVLKENLATQRRAPISTPTSPSSHPSAPPPKRRSTLLIGGAILGGALVVAATLFTAIRLGPSQSNSLVTPLAAVTPTRSLSSSPTPSVLAAMPSPSFAIATPSPTDVVLVTPTAAVGVAPATPSPNPTPTPDLARLALERATKEVPWTNSLGMKFVPVPGTRVLFSIWDTRVQDYQAFVDQTGYNATGGMYSLRKDGLKQRGASWKEPGFRQESTYPVVGLSWNDARAFCAWLTRTERAAAQLPESWSYRLPTDREWSTAVGLDDETGDTPKEKNGKIIDAYPWGKEWPPPPGAGNYFGEEAKIGAEPSTYVAIKGYNDGWPRTSPVGTFAANQFGLADMGGNVWQWCEDWFDQTRQYRVLRGASWCNFSPAGLLSSSRGGGNPDSRSDNSGCRCVLAQESSR